MVMYCVMPEGHGFIMFIPGDYTDKMRVDLPPSACFMLIDPILD